ncbi:MAG: carbamoyl phosphate synthase, partial [Actinomycetota bacterium]|nr:carbamoyl phosphate synthase [Actinomycetota bacterium]
ATTIPADLAILEHADFQAGVHSTKWVEEVLDLSAIGSVKAAPSSDDDAEPKVRRDVDVEVNGKRFSVSVWMPESAMVASGGSGGARKPKRRAASGGGAGGSGSGDVTVPMQGTIVKVSVEVGQEVAVGDTIVVLEAMKMENNVTADKAGTVSEIRVSAGDSVGGGDVVAKIE